ncbi:MAG TPA: Gfo/Idh/MocA family oxidoreductase [Candidatus Hydrogenedentes bacterium]|nr:Gfo/Idh/MocA family oxidoreductase [Candidatus Hydrogenedentota bacterium]HRK33325.1 Gfo/Idh/MocA family oxidoreductase [Candidatus Hydrogenedentota bacterium]
MKQTGSRRGLSRRQFLKKGGAAALGVVALPNIVPSSVLGLDGSVPPSERIVVASIGVGGQGTANLRAFLGQRDAQVMGVCDVDYQRACNARDVVHQTYGQFMQSGEYKGCEVYTDFRAVLDREDVDAVVICSPDHWHAVISVMAAKAGKDMYTEKPLANGIADGRRVVDAVKRYGRIFQTGSHERSRTNARYAAELVRNGRIGKLHTVHVNLPVDNHAPIGPQPVMPVPEGFDYDLWLGPAPWAPYTEKRCHFWFRYILDYSGGEVTDRGAHIIDLARMGHGTDLTGPVEVEGKGDFPRDGLFNTAMDYNFSFTFKDGVRYLCKQQGPRGVKFEGDKGWVFIHVHGGHLEAEPSSLLKEIIGPDEIHLGRSPGHHRDFLNNVKTRGECFAAPEIGHRTATMCHLANIAMRLERPLKWNPDTERFTNDDEANRMLEVPQRSPWRLV